MASKKFQMGISLIVCILIACGNTQTKSQKVKRVPKADSTDTFLFYKLPPADFTLHKDSTHIGYWYSRKSSEDVKVLELYTKNNLLYSIANYVYIYIDSVDVTSTFEMSNYADSNKVKMENFFFLTFLNDDTLLYELQNRIAAENLAHKMYRIPRVTFPREQAVHYFNTCRKHVTTTIFRWVYGSMPVYSRFYKKGDSTILEAYSRSGKLSHHAIKRNEQKDGAIRFEHIGNKWQSALEYFLYYPAKQLLLLKNPNIPERSDTAKIIYNVDYEYDFYAGDSLFYYGNPDIEEW